MPSITGQTIGSLKPQPPESPRHGDNARIRRLRELREKRLAYFLESSQNGSKENNNNSINGCDSQHNQKQQPAQNERKPEIPVKSETESKTAIFDAIQSGCSTGKGVGHCVLSDQDIQQAMMRDSRVKTIQSLSNGESSPLTSQDLTLHNSANERFEASSHDPSEPISGDHQNITANQLQPDSTAYHVKEPHISDDISQISMNTDKNCPSVASLNIIDSARDDSSNKSSALTSPNLMTQQNESQGTSYTLSQSKEHTTSGVFTWSEEIKDTAKKMPDSSTKELENSWDFKLLGGLHNSDMTESFSSTKTGLGASNTISLIHMPAGEHFSEDKVDDELKGDVSNDFEETWESLEDVLGKSRLSRLMRNLRETDDVLGDDPDTKTEGVYANFYANSGVKDHNSWWNVGSDDEKSVSSKEEEETDRIPENGYNIAPSLDGSYIEEIGLQTHRPEENRADIEAAEVDSPSSHPSIKPAKFAYSADEIYQEAEKISLLSPSAESKQMDHFNPVPSSTAITLPEAPSGGEEVNIDMNGAVYKGYIVTEEQQRKKDHKLKGKKEVKKNQTHRAQNKKTTGTAPQPHPKVPLSSTLERYFASIETVGLQELNHEIVDVLTEETEAEDAWFETDASVSHDKETDNSPSWRASPDKLPSADAQGIHNQDGVYGVNNRNVESFEETEPLTSRQRMKLSMNMVTVCPDCMTLNKTESRYCGDCGYLLIHVAPVPIKSKMADSPKRSVSTYSQTGNESRIPLNPVISRTQQLDAMETHSSLSSENFEYTPRDDQRKAIPLELKDQLTLNLNMSTESLSVASQLSNRPHSANNKNGRSAVRSNKLIANLSENINFEYEMSESPIKDLPHKLKQQLSLNLADVDSDIDSGRDRRINTAVAVGQREVMTKATGGGGDTQGLDSKFRYTWSDGVKLDDKSMAQLRKSLREQGAGDGPSQPAGDLSILQSRDLSGLQSKEQPGLRSKDQTMQVGDSATLQNRGSPTTRAAMPTPPSGESPKMNARETLENRRSVSQQDKAVSAWGSTDSINQPQDNASSSPGPKPASKHHVNFAPQPISSSGRPSSATQNRPSSANVHSRLASKSQTYERRWETSSFAWSSVTAKDLRLSGVTNGRPSRSDKPRVRPSSAKLTQSRDHRSLQQSVNYAEKSFSPVRPKSAGANRPSPKKDTNGQILTVTQPNSNPGRAKMIAEYHTRNTYARYVAMSPRISEGAISYMECLPDEILLHIFSYLPARDLGSCAMTCSLLKRIAADSSLWRSICLKKRQQVKDFWLIEIGKHQPRQLSLIQCQGEKVTANGLRELFRHCADSLQDLNFTGCSNGYLNGDNILLHAASRCHNITHLDASWSNICDNGITAIAESSHRLESVCLNGCQRITDEAVHALVVKHGIYLRVLEVFGGFNLTAAAMIAIGNHCKGLITLNIGQCWKLSDVSVAQLTTHVPMLENLDVRGVKQLTDSSVHQIVKNCVHLQSLSIANCPNVTDVSLVEVSTYCTQIRSLDVSGCRKLTNSGFRPIANNCQSLEFLDLSSTGITSKGVSSIASYCGRHLEVIKLNFTKGINMACMRKLAKSCKRLRKVYLYGVSGVRQVEQIRMENPNLQIEM